MPSYSTHLGRPFLWNCCSLPCLVSGSPACLLLWGLGFRLIRFTFVQGSSARRGSTRVTDFALLRSPCSRRSSWRHRSKEVFFPTCQVRVVRFYVSPISSSSASFYSSSSSAGPHPRPSTPSVPCRTSTTTIHAQGSLPDLNHSTQPQTHNYKHITTNIQLQTHNHKHNHKHTTNNT